MILGLVSMVVAVEVAVVVMLVVAAVVMVVVVDVGHLGDPSFVVCKPFVICTILSLNVCRNNLFSGLNVFSFVCFPATVLVTGLPSSASWQDLKVGTLNSFLFLPNSNIPLNYCFDCRITCVKEETSVSHKCTVMVEVSSSDTCLVFARL